MPRPTYEELEQKIHELEGQKKTSSQKDVRTSRQADYVLAESEEKYKTLFENMVQGVFYQRSDGELIDCNSAALEMFGLSRDQFMGKTSMAPEWHVIAEDGSDLPGNQHPSMVALTSGKPVYDFLAAVYNPKKNDYVWLNINAIPLFKNGEANPYQVFVTLHDVTRLKLSEAALAESEKRFRTLTSLSPGGIYQTDRDGNCVYANDAWLLMAGMTFDEAKVEGWIKGIYSEDHDRIKQGWYDMVKTKGKWKDEYRFINKEGKITWVLGLATPMYDEDNTITGYLGLNIDITERKQAEEDLEISKNKIKEAYRFMQLVVETIPVRLFWKDLDSHFLGCNQLFAQDAGVSSSEELIGGDDYALGWKDQAEQYRKDDLEVMTSGKPKLNYEESQTTPEGRKITLLTSKVPIRDENDVVIGILGTYDDITQRKRMENEILRTQKLESLGRLAGGIAHDLNNSLMGIMGNISLAKMGCSPTGEIYERLTNAETACMTAKDLSKQFLIFSKGGDPVRVPTLTAKLIKANCQLALSGTKSICKTNISDDLWNIYADAGQIGQVVTNLLINANEAMPDGGVITLNCENVIIGTNHELPLKSGNYVKISIIDQGFGINEDNIDLVFDPYFSTKKSGTGLGLAAAYSIIKKHEGYIGVESTSETGTVFSIFIPASRSSVTTTEEKEPSIIKGKGRVLVMDDNEIVLDAIGMMLEHLGYDVDFAEDGEKAFNSYEKAMQSESPYDMVLMDLMVPGGMGGEEATQKLLSLDPEAKVVVTSGYSNDPIMANHKRYGFCGVIKKPYRLDELSRFMNQFFND
ncbi:PAS domain-containing sensor histidine kinase [Desulfopila sp. IMCC35008]|uniref:PAS domain-containing hybrid sensor histidine kinase/response regulator n=1 Tax=Desulfopila sp. IMCC35008 TaxID=2653858 RepID=UPI0013D054B5|nr:PAS domain-containing sensor histidine kinase [Desulfopila sp. IMCC35008]